MRRRLQLINCIFNGKSRNFYYHTQRDAISDIIKIWYETGVIVDTPARNPYNNSLNVSTKVLPDGSEKMRVCISPVILNE
jgi:hypothetical protein